MKVVARILLCVAWTRTGWRLLRLMPIDPERGHRLFLWLLREGAP